MASEDVWACRVCTFANHVLLPVCEMCEAERFQVEDEDDVQRQMLEPEDFLDEVDAMAMDFDDMRIKSAVRQQRRKIRFGRRRVKTVPNNFIASAPLGSRHRVASTSNPPAPTPKPASMASSYVREARKRLCPYSSRTGSDPLRKARKQCEKAPRSTKLTQAVAKVRELESWLKHAGKLSLNHVRRLRKRATAKLRKEKRRQQMASGQRDAEDEARERRSRRRDQSFDTFRRRFFFDHEAELYSALSTIESIRVANVASNVSGRFMRRMRSCGVEPVLRFHGTAPGNIASIQRRGLLVPGAKGVSVANGSAYGVGIYTASHAGTSVYYTRDGNTMFVCAVIDDTASQKLRGKTAPVERAVVAPPRLLPPAGTKVKRTLSGRPAHRVTRRVKVGSSMRARQAPSSVYGNYGRRTANTLAAGGITVSFRADHVVPLFQLRFSKAGANMGAPAPVVYSAAGLPVGLNEGQLPVLNNGALHSQHMERDVVELVWEAAKWCGQGRQAQFAKRSILKKRRDRERSLVVRELSSWRFGDVHDCDHVERDAVDQAVGLAA